MKLRNHLKKKLNYFCSLLRLPNVVQIISQAFNKIVVASFSFFLSTASSRLIRVLTLISLLFHSFNSAELSFSSSSSNALILSSNVFFYQNKEKISDNLCKWNDLLTYLLSQLFKIGWLQKPLLIFFHVLHGNTSNRSVHLFQETKSN